MGLGFFLMRSPSGRTWVGHTGGMPGHITGVFTHRASGTGGIVLMSSTASPAPDAFAIELADHVVEHDPVEDAPWQPGTEVPDGVPPAAGPLVLRGSALRLLGRAGRAARTHRQAGRRAADGLALREGRRRRLPRRERPRARRAPAGHPCRRRRRSPSSTGRRTSSRASRSPSASRSAPDHLAPGRRVRRAQPPPAAALTTSTPTLRASATAWSSTARRGSGTASQGPTTVDLPQARVGEHLVDGTVVAAGDERERPRPEDPRRMVGGRLVGLPRLVVAATGEALLALAAGLGPALHVALADLVLDQALALEPGDGEAALAHEQDAPRPGRLGGRREGGDVGRSGVRRRERQAGDERRAVTGLPCQRARRGRRARSPRGASRSSRPSARPGPAAPGPWRRRHAQVTRAPSAHRSSPVSSSSSLRFHRVR